jgi:hypothetical protein
MSSRARWCARQCRSSGTEALAGGERGFGEDFSQTKVELAELAGGDGLLLGDAQDFFADGGREVDRGVVEEFGPEIWWCTGDLGHRNVNGVGGSAGHEAEDEEATRFHVGRKTISPQRARRTQKRKRDREEKDNVV